MEPKSLQQDILYFAKRGFLTRFNRRVRLRQSSDRPRYFEPGEVLVFGKI